MADLEEHAFRRDRSFLVKLVVLLVLGALFGLWAASHLTTRGFGGCAARAFGASSGETDETGGPAAE